MIDLLNLLYTMMNLYVVVGFLVIIALSCLVVKNKKDKKQKQSSTPTSQQI